jgi:hypothetical protein
MKVSVTNSDTDDDDLLIVYLLNYLFICFLIIIIIYGPTLKLSSHLKTQSFF